jgi:hypothetical protein
VTTLCVAPFFAAAAGVSVLLQEVLIVAAMLRAAMADSGRTGMLDIRNSLN